MIHETPCAAFRAPLSRTGAQSLVKCRGAGQKVADATWSREVNKIAYRAVHTYPTHNSGIITSKLVPSFQVTALPHFAHSTCLRSRSSLRQRRAIFAARMPRRPDDSSVLSNRC